jgi:hypothetical protein
MGLYVTDTANFSHTHKRSSEKKLLCEFHIDSVILTNWFWNRNSNIAASTHRTTALYHFDQLPIDPIKIVCLQEKWISGGKTFDILCLFCRSYELICAWKGWLYVSIWKLLFVFLYHWHFGGLWTTFLQIVMSKFNVMNFHPLFYKTSYFSSYDSTSILKLYLLPSFWCMKHYPNFNCCVIHFYSTARVTKMIWSTSDAWYVQKQILFQWRHDQLP